jgi:hypothetical protein
MRDSALRLNYLCKRLARRAQAPVGPAAGSGAHLVLAPGNNGIHGVLAALVAMHQRFTRVVAAAAPLFRVLTRVNPSIAKADSIEISVAPGIVHQ